MKRKSSIGYIFSSAGSGRRFFAAAIILCALAIIFNFLMPQVIRFTVDSIIGDEPMSLPGFLLSLVDRLGGRSSIRLNLIFCALAVVVCAVLSGAFNYLSRTSIARGTETLIKNLRDTLFSHIQHLPFSWHTKNQTGDIIQRCTSDVDTLRGFVSQQFLEIIRTVLLIAFALVMMFSMNTLLAFITLAFTPLIILYSVLFHGRISKQFLVADESEGELTVAVQENLTGVRVVRAFGRERYEKERFEEKNNLFAEKWIGMGYTLGLYWGVGDVVSCVQLLTIICAGSYLAATGSLTLGELLVFISYTQTLAWPVRNMGRTLSELSKALVSVKRIREILDTPVEPDEPDAKKPDLNADITFENVSFSYGDQEILKNISFTIENGGTFGILGATGSGKSTIAYLMNRLYDLPEGAGKITVGGTDILDIDRSHLRRGVGLVLQEPFLFSKTVKENIAIASSASDLDRVRHYAGIAAVDKSITEFKDGYDTIVGERGVTLSGGQKQRIAMARTLMMNCPILIFDDSMSAVDMETDEKIRLSLRDNVGSSTIILISHRINTLMQADKILVLDGGRVAQLGTHRELLGQEGIYRRVYKMQSDAGLLGGDGNG